MISFDGITERLIRACQGTSYHFERPYVISVDDALAWLHDQAWAVKIETDRGRRLQVKRLLFARWLIGQGRCSDSETGPSEEMIRRAVAIPLAPETRTRR